MPGILYHLSFAELVYKKISSTLSIDKIDFMSGNLIPDLAKNKKSAHYSIPATQEGFLVPNMELATKNLFSIKNSLKLGIFCHLYLDYHFIEDFLIPDFIWDYKNGKVINQRNNKEWKREECFSSMCLYGSYTEINTLMIKNNHISYTKLYIETKVKVNAFIFLTRHSNAALFVVYNVSNGCLAFAQN